MFRRFGRLCKTPLDKQISENPAARRTPELIRPKPELKLTIYPHELGEGPVRSAALCMALWHQAVGGCSVLVGKHNHQNSRINPTEPGTEINHLLA
jgi:hypothetical protein